MVFQAKTGLLSPSLATALDFEFYLENLRTRVGSTRDKGYISHRIGPMRIM
jgi:hypothetical protein